MSRASYLVQLLVYHQAGEASSDREENDFIEYPHLGRSDQLYDHEYSSSNTRDSTSDT